MRSMSPPLETFLSGMETRVSGNIPDFLIPLETFLSGMETPAAGPRYGGVPALKPSLVEWKRRAAAC